MAGFGGAVKLTGESEYRNALKNITQSLREVSSQLQLNATKYDSNDKSIQNLAKKQEDLNKIYKTQETEVNKLRTTYESFSKKVQEQAQAHSTLEQRYKTEKTELDKIAKTLGTTSKEYQDQKKKVDELEKSLIKSRQENDNNRNALSRMGTALNKAETDLIKTSKEMSNFGEETKQTSKDVKTAGDGFTVFKGILSNLATKAISTAVSGLKQLSGAVINVGKQAIASYAEYEQLIGGVETLFKDSAKEVEGYADIAYKTAGISANKYMEQVTSFSASLLQGLNGDTAKTAKIADMAIIDMADNANKMGTSMEMIQNAYQGFAKQNFTMLDNLKLGYGGTKTEMVRLINDSKILNKEIKNLDGITFDQIVQAIHVVQTNIGITGTTAKEADTTIQGSVNSMKASWSNLLTAIADDNKDLSKSVNEFVGSAITASKNLIPRIKQVVDGFQRLGKAIVNEVFPKIKREIPQLRPLIEVFEWFVKNKDKVATAIKVMVGAFAVAKIAQFTKSLSDGTKSLLEWVKTSALATTATNANTTAQVANTTAQVAGTGATKALTVATNLLNSAWKANPIGVVVTAVMTLVSVYKLLNKENEEARKAQEEQRKELEAHTEEIIRNKDALNERLQATRDIINSGFSELSYYERLYKELNSIVDQNGKVKEGYEQRASFITTTLKDALGVEISLVGNQIKGMNELRDSIQKVIDKKKAEIILEAQKEDYADAIKNEATAYRELTDTTNSYNAKNEELKKTEAEIEELYRRHAETRKNALGVYSKESQEIALQISNKTEYAKTLQNETSEYEKQMKAQEEIVKKYAYTKGIYETNMALAHSEQYEKMKTADYEYAKHYEGMENAEKAIVEDKIKYTQAKLDILQDMRDESNKEIIDGQIESAKIELENHKNDLEKYRKATEEGLDKVELEWDDSLASQLSVVSGSKVEFKDAGNGQVQAYIDGVKTGEPKSKEEMAKLTSNAIQEIKNKKGEAIEAGENLAEGVGNGVDNKQNNIFSKIRSFGMGLLANLKDSLQEQSPSKATKQMGQYLLEGLGLGIESKQRGVLNQVASLGKNILSTFDTNLNSDALNANLTAQIQGGIPTNTTVNTSAIRQAQEQNYSYNNMVLAFQEALASMKIELDDEEAGRFVRKTVENAIYT